MNTSQRGNTDVVSAFYDALIAEDAERALDALGTDVKWYEAPGSPYGNADGSPYRGGLEVAKHVLGPQTSDVAELRLTQRQMLTFGASTIIVLGVARGRGRHTGLALEVPFAHVWLLEGRLIGEFRQYIDVPLFRAAVGKPA